MDRVSAGDMGTMAARLFKNRGTRADKSAGQFFT
jgi:hypothetical protein